MKRLLSWFRRVVLRRAAVERPTLPPSGSLEICLTWEQLTSEENAWLRKLIDDLVTNAGKNISWSVGQPNEPDQIDLAREEGRMSLRAVPVREFFFEKVDNFSTDVFRQGGNPK